MSFVLSCCSTVDMAPDFFEKRSIEYICFHYQINGKEYMDDLGQSLSFDAFYQAMRDGASTSTSQISAGEYEDYFESFLKEGKDVLHLTLSSGISGTVQSATVAKEALAAKYPDRKLIIMDSLCACSGYGLLMEKLADLRDTGKTIEEVAAWAEEYRLHVHHWFFTGDLTYLIRGGRVSKAAGMVGKMLNICPLLNVDYMGRLISRYKIRTMRKAIIACEQQMEEHAENGLDYNGKVYIAHSDCYDDARKLADLVEERFPKLSSKVEINTIGTTIGSHTGPGLVALFFMGDKRID